MIATLDLLGSLREYKWWKTLLYTHPLLLLLLRNQVLRSLNVILQELIHLVQSAIYKFATFE